MALDVAKRGIDSVARNATKRERPQFGLNFHGGGEPSLNWKTMTGAMSYALGKAAQLGLSVHATSATNGMLNDSQIDWMVEHLKGASLSFDGLPSVQDRHRVTVTGKGRATA
jgi:uncharacterized protein